MDCKVGRLIFFLILISGCGMKQQERLKTGDQTIKEIILVNGGTSDRCQMGELVQSISKCKPKVIGVNFLFVGEKGGKCDSILQQAIIDSEKVVLAEGMENGNHIESSDLFSSSAMLTGITGLAQNNNGIIESYVRVTDDRGKWVFSFPFHLALQYEKNRASELVAKSPSKPYPIIASYSLGDFKTINDVTTISKNCSEIEGKIVLIGYLGPGDEDVFKARITKNSSGKVFGTVILANVIVDILSDLDKN